MSDVLLRAEEGDVVRLSSRERLPGESQPLYESRVRDVEFLDSLASEAGLLPDERAALWRILLDGQMTYEKTQLECLSLRHGIDENTACMNNARVLIVEEHWQRVREEVPSATRTFSSSVVEFVVGSSGRAFEKPPRFALNGER